MNTCVSELIINSNTINIKTGEEEKEEVRHRKCRYVETVTETTHRTQVKCNNQKDKKPNLV